MLVLPALTGFSACFECAFSFADDMYSMFLNSTPLCDSMSNGSLKIRELFCSEDFVEHLGRRLSQFSWS